MNLNALNDGGSLVAALELWKKECVRRLIIPVLDWFEQMRKDMLEEAQRRENDGGKCDRDELWKYYLAIVPNWSSELKESETQMIVSRTENFREILKQIFAHHVAILRTLLPQETSVVSIPKPSDFVHQLLIVLAESLMEEPSDQAVNARSIRKKMSTYVAAAFEETLMRKLPFDRLVEAMAQPAFQPPPQPMMAPVQPPAVQPQAPIAPIPSPLPSINKSSGALSGLLKGSRENVSLKNLGGGRETSVVLSNKLGKSTSRSRSSVSSSRSKVITVPQVSVRGSTGRHLSTSSSSSSSSLDTSSDHSINSDSSSY